MIGLAIEAESLDSSGDTEVIVERSGFGVDANYPHQLWDLSLEQMKRVFEAADIPVPFDCKRGKFFILMVK